MSTTSVFPPHYPRDPPSRWIRPVFTRRADIARQLLETWELDPRPALSSPTISTRWVANFGSVALLARRGSMTRRFQRRYRSPIKRNDRARRGEAHCCACPNVSRYVFSSTIIRKRTRCDRPAKTSSKARLRLVASPAAAGSRNVQCIMSADSKAGQTSLARSQSVMR